MIHLRRLLFALLVVAPALHAENPPLDLRPPVIEAPAQDAASATPPASTAQPAGAAAAQPPAALVQTPIADLAEAQKVQAELTALIRAYETGNINYLQSRLDPAMIGYQRFIDGVVRDNNQLKQLRIQLFDTQVLAGPDVAVIQTGWEKRFLSLVGFQPGLFTGHSTFLLHRDQDQWKIAAFSGDNLFASQSGVRAQLSASPTVLIAPPNGCPCPTLSFTLLDPDLAGQGSAVVEVISSQGDRENLSLAATTPGRFTGSIATNSNNGAPINVGSGVLDINSNSALFPITVTVRYLDQNPGSNRPPSYITQTLRVVP
jgi:hypothetical protein